MQNLPNIPLSLGGELLFEVSNMNLRIKTSLVGMEKGTFLLTKLSSSDLMGTFRSHSVRQNPSTISYLHDNVVYGCWTNTNIRTCCCGTYVFRCAVWVGSVEQ